MSQINRHKIILASQRGVGLSRARIACEKNQVDKRKAAFLDGKRKDGFSIELAETSQVLVTIHQDHLGNGEFPFIQNSLNLFAFER